MNIYDGFGYTGGQFKLIYQDTIGYLQGNSLGLWNLENNKKEYIQSSKNGFQCFCSNYKHKLIAVAEYGLNPQVFVYAYPSREQILTLDGVSELEIVMMDFSFDGRYLLVVTGVPKYEINIWDLSTGEKLSGQDSVLPQKFNFKSASFSITDRNKFVIMYQKSLLIYEIVPSYEREQEVVSKKIKLELMGQFTLTGLNQYIVWDYQSELDMGDGRDQTNIYLVQDYILIYLSGTDLHEICRYECAGAIKHLVVTQKHLIVVYQSGLIEWIFKYISVNVSDQTLLPFKLDKQYNQFQDSNSHGRTSQVMYNHSYTKLFIGMSDASLVVLQIPAETSMEDEDEGVEGKEHGENESQNGQVKVIDAESLKLGPYQTGSVTFLREFKSVHVLVSGSSSGKIVFWDILRRDALTSLQVKGAISSGDLAADQILVIGSDLGVVRIYNIANIRKPLLIKTIKVFKGKAVSQVSINPTSDTIAVSSTHSKKVYFLNLKYMSLIGYVILPIKCNNITWNTSKKSGPPLLFALTSFLLISIQAPDPTQQYDSLLLTRDNCPMSARKIDPDQFLLAVHPTTGDVITAGRDKVFKKYKVPEEQIQKIDLKVRIANQSPIDEHDGHQLQPTCMVLSAKLGLCSGSQDGSIIMRSYDRLGSDIAQFNGHSLRSGGVSALEVSNKNKMIYSGGFDGGIFWWCSDRPSKSESDAEKVMRNQFDIPIAEDDVDDVVVKHYQQVLEEEYMESQAPIREQQKKDKKDLLQVIIDKLNALIEANRVADDMEKLSRDEFVIDTAARNQIMEGGQKQCQELREQVKRENYRQEILYKLIKERTWDQMECQLKGINGLHSNILVTNFHIRIRGVDETRKLQMVKELRQQELKEKNIRKEKKIGEVWQIEDLIQDPRAYIVNAIGGQPTLVLTDYEKKEDPMQATKQNSKAAPGAKGAVRGGKAPAKPTETKKQEEEREREEKEAAEKEKAQAVAKVEEKKEGEEFGEWDYIYGSFELFSGNRKRNQMILLNNIIFSIKRQFNIEFEKMMQARQTEVENISERNKRITEILLELKKPVDLFVCKKNVLENPEVVLSVSSEEVPFQKYLSKEERERRDVERKKEEDRLAALMKDDSGVRAIKDMMGGTLEEKKETPLDEKLEVEDWMNKPVDEMTEEERSRLKEFEVKKQRLEEEKEKIRKNLESELKKLKNEILDVCYRFDERLLVLFRRKLEYDYRIYEQELYMIRLALSIIMQESGNIKLKDLTSLIAQLEVKEQQAVQMQEELELLRRETETQRQKSQEQMNLAYNVKSNYGFDAGKIKNIWLYAFEEIKKDDKKQKELDKKLLNDPVNKDILVLVDPLYEFEKKELKKDKDTVFDNFLKDIQEKVTNLQLFDWNDAGARDFTISTLQNRFNVKKEFEKFDLELTDLKNYCQFYTNELQSIQVNLEVSHSDQLDISTMMEKSKSNIEVLIRFKQGFVEITSDKPVPTLTEAVLIPRKLIDEKNKEIQGQGDHKIKLMEDIKKIKFDVAQSEYQLKRRELVIKDLECKTREVQLLKVKKEMQVALTKKDTRLNDQELKNLQDQIDMLKQATEKRILIYVKKEDKIKKDIEFIQKENEQLLQQGANLNVSVKQLQEISDMTFKKNAKQASGDDISDNQAFDKFRQIASNRKYFDLAKKQTEEIELLREELNKLKARTFANFANVSR